MNGLDATVADGDTLFQKLKPCCVKISQLAIRRPFTENAVPGELSKISGELFCLLKSHVNILDEKLAEYCFFPLFHLFRQVHQCEATVVENCLKCLSILITYGWKSKVSAELAKQIFSLTVFIIDPEPDPAKKVDGKTKQIPEETALEAFRTQNALFQTIASSATAASGITHQDAMPMLGHGVTVMLDSATLAANPHIQREALRAVKGLFSSLRDTQALASVLPGVVSSLTGLLALPSRQKQLVLAECLRSLQIVLTRILGDIGMTNLLTQTQTEGVSGGKGARKVLDQAWLGATTSQVKLALSRVVKLRNVDSPKVRKALERLCVALLDECRATLSNCTSLLVETAIIVDDVSDAAETKLKHLAGIHTELAESAQQIVYRWMTSLASVLEGRDEETKRAAVRHLSKGLMLVQEIDSRSPALENLLSSTLIESMASLLRLSSHKLAHMAQTDVIALRQAFNTPSRQEAFQPVLLSHQSQSSLISELETMVDGIESMTLRSKIAADMMAYVHSASSTEQTCAMWLCLKLVEHAFQYRAETDAYLDLSTAVDSRENIDAIFDDLFNYAVGVLDNQSTANASDWRLEAVSLEVVTFAAQRSGSAFRAVLIDVLFPIAVVLGSENAPLQQHAVIALNKMATSCGYATTSNLVIENVDYMVNSVALRLNSLDITPASMQVLNMMIRLTGPRLIPFLDDVVDSIFTALENYHGYAGFVQSLFSVLKEIVDQAGQLDQNLLSQHERESRDHRKRRATGNEFKTLFDILEKRAEHEAEDSDDAASGSPVEGHPEVPWTSEYDKGEEGDVMPVPSTVGPSDEKPPHSPTYTLLLRIAYLTQHYLTSPAPSLRRSLLELITKASPLLAGDEDSFLPLINAIWPVVVKNLYDPETFVALEAVVALVSLCEGAGDFMSSRFELEWDSTLREWCQRVKRNAKRSPEPRKFRSGRLATASSRADLLILGPPKERASGVWGSTVENDGHMGGLGPHAATARLWEATVRLLTAIVSYVRIKDDMFSQVLDLLAEEMEEKKEVKEALETINADAVWHARFERGLIEVASADERGEMAS